MSAPAAPEGWLGQSGLAWNILLTADAAPPPPTSTLRDRLDALAGRQGWPAAAADAVVEGERPQVMSVLAAREDHRLPVAVGRTPEGIVVGAHHAYVDGLGLLAVTAQVTASAITSRAAGVDDSRSSARDGGSLVRRLGEVAARPPAGVAGSGNGTEAADTFARTTIDGPVRTAALVHAGTQAVAAWNRAHQQRADRVAVAVGVSRAGGTRGAIADHSGFLRLTDVERLSAAEVASGIGHAPLQLGGAAQGRVTRAASGLIRTAARVLAPRLGSTLLVSHLGTLDAPGLDAVAFYPLAGGGSGVSLGAATLHGRTVLTLRARGAAHTRADLEDLLATVADRLG